MNELICGVLKQICHDYSKQMKSFYFYKSNCLKNGVLYETKCFDILNTIPNMKAKTPAGSSDKVDIQCKYGIQTFGIEIKNKGSFEGGSKKLYPTSNGMQIIEECIIGTNNYIMV